MPPTKRTKLAALEPDPGPKPRPNLVQSLPKREINSMPEIQVINLKQGKYFKHLLHLVYLYF